MLVPFHLSIDNRQIALHKITTNLEYKDILTQIILCVADIVENVQWR